MFSGRWSPVSMSATGMCTRSASYSLGKLPNQFPSTAGNFDGTIILLGTSAAVHIDGFQGIAIKDGNFYPLRAQLKHIRKNTRHDIVAHQRPDCLFARTLEITFSLRFRSRTIVDIQQIN